MVPTPAPPLRNDCAGCLHFQITYDPSQPYACQVFGFRSQTQPWRVVLEQSGEACQAREERILPQDSRPKRA